MIFEKHRFEIWNLTQHPYKHSLAEFAFSNPALPGVTNVEAALNWVLAVLYPNTKPAVATPAALPALGNALNDYRVVLDDGDGKSAGYRWEQREGDVAPQWYKIFDFDWSTDAVLSAFTDIAQDLFVFKRGKSDLDASGAPLVGVFAGQRVWGGNLTGQNLTLDANSVDGTGYVQVNSNFRPTANNIYDVGTPTERFKDGHFAGDLYVDTLTFSGGSITDSSGAISFGNENLSTTGNITGAIVTGSSLVADDTVDTITIVPGLITDTTGTISFGAANLTTSGTSQSDTITATDGVETLVFEPNAGLFAQITSSLGAIDFSNENLTTTGNITGSILYGGQLDIDNVRIDGSTISIIPVNGSLTVQANGTGVVNFGCDIDGNANDFSNFATGDINTSLTVSVLQLDDVAGEGRVQSTVGDLLLESFSGNIILNAASGTLSSALDNSYDLGTLSERFADLFLAGIISDGTDNITIGTLLSFRSGIWRDLAQTLPAQAGDTLFWDAVNGVWLANHPDTEIAHDEISGLTTGDAGHTQFVMLAGRAGGQVVQGGIAASENLTLESTAHATKGYVFTSDIFAPLTNASYSGGWSGLDLGDSTHYFRDVYTKGEHFGLRLENLTVGTLPSASVQNVGRLVYTTDDDAIYGDTGTALKRLSYEKFSADQVFDGIITLLDVDISASISDARTALWQLKDNANNFEVMGVTLLATSATNVRITTNIPLPAGSYRLVGVN